MRNSIFYKTLFLFVFLYAWQIDAQTDLKSFNIFNRSAYLIKGQVREDNTYVFTLSKEGEQANEQVTFSLRPFTKEAFIQNFFTSFKTFQSKVADSDEMLKIGNLDFENPPGDEPGQKAYRKLEEEATRLFYMFVAGSIVTNNLKNEPIAGEICFYDSIQILRRDFNDKSSDRAMKRLWKVYKTDGRIVRKLLNKGFFDRSLWLNESTSFDPDAILTNQILKGLLPEAADTNNLNPVSEQFSFSELSENLNKRTYTRKKGNELLKKRAASRKAQYEKATDELDANRVKLGNLKNDLTAHTNTLTRIGELISIEKRRVAMEKPLNASRNKVRQNMQSTVGSINSALRGSLNSFNKLTFSSPEKLTGLNNLLNPLVRSFVDSFDKLSQCECTAECDNLASNLKKTIEQGKSALDEGVRNENEIMESRIQELNARIMEKQEAGDTDIALLEKQLEDVRGQITANVKTLGEIKGIYTDIPAKIDAVYNASRSYCGYADTIAGFDRQQLEIAGQISQDKHRDRILLVLTNRQNNSLAAAQDTVSNYVDSLESVKTAVEGEIRVLNSRIDTLQKSIKNQGWNLFRMEDQLIFKSFKVDSIVIEINEGFIENILMVGKVREFTDKYENLSLTNDGKAVSALRTLKFENSSPIGFSRKLDYDVIKGIKLYTRGGSRTHYETFLEDVLSIYIQTHKVGRRDYSPANQVITLRKDLAGLKNSAGEQTQCLPLKKEATYRLFEAKVFSDFVGLDETEPNGLIQTEVSKQINLLTSRKPFKFFTLGGLRNDWNLGFLSFLEPSVTLSKIENNRRSLVLNNKDRFINNQYTPVKFASTLSLKQFENFSAGAALNLLLLDMPDLKSTIYLNWGFGYGRTAIQDSIRTGSGGVVRTDSNGVEEYGVNTFTHYPEVVWSIFEDERYGLSFGWQHHWFYLRDNRFEQVANSAYFQDQEINRINEAQQYNAIRFLTWLEPGTNSKGRLFFRYTYNWQQGFWRTGFHQAQVGYSFYLLGRQAE